MRPPVLDNLTILTLMSGRDYCIEAYFYALGELEWDKHSLDLVFYCTSPNRPFQRWLEKKANAIRDHYRSVRLIFDASLPPSEHALDEAIDDGHSHRENIAATYQKATDLVQTRYVLLWEDDITIPSHSLKRLGRAILSDPTIANASGVAFARQSPHWMLAHELEIQRIFGDLDSSSEVKVVRLLPFREWWGVKVAPITSFCCALLDMEVVRRLGFTAQCPEPEGRERLDACDLIFCYRLMKLGYKSVIDFDVRAFHHASDGSIH